MDGTITRRRPVIVIMIGAFWPGSDSAGPNQSVRGLCRALADRFDFRIVARDRPFGATRPLAPVGEWVDRGFAQVRYLPVAPVTGAVGLGRLLRTTPHDLLMSNGFFDREFTLPALVMRRSGRVPRAPMIVSTRGEFAGGALGLKSGRKRAVLTLAGRLSLHRDVLLHATSAAEAADVERGYPHAKGVVVAPNVRLIGPLPEQPARPAPGQPLRLAFVGRIARVKNLDYALRALVQVATPVEYDIFGPIQEADHWAECQALIAALPEHVRVTHMGEMANDEMVATLAGYDLLYLPTKGENFGHAIMDALEAGTPVLISDQTPFRGLAAAKAGFDLPLADPRAFAAAIDRYAGFDEATRLRWRAGARALAERTVAESDAVTRNVEMLERVMAGSNAIGAR